MGLYPGHGGSSCPVSSGADGGVEEMDPVWTRGLGWELWEGIVVDPKALGESRGSEVPLHLSSGRLCESIWLRKDEVTPLMEDWHVLQRGPWVCSFLVLQPCHPTQASLASKILNSSHQGLQRATVGQRERKEG